MASPFFDARNVSATAVRKRVGGIELAGLSLVNRIRIIEAVPRRRGSSADDEAIELDQTARNVTNVLGSIHDTSWVQLRDRNVSSEK